MGATICFATFLILANLICFIWFCIIGLDIYGSLIAPVAIISVIIFGIFKLICNRYVDGSLSSSKKEIKYFLTSVAILFFALLSINLFFYSQAINNGGTGSGIVMLVVIPVTVFMLILYLLYSALYFGVLAIVSAFKKNQSNNICKPEQDNSNEKFLLKWWQDLILNIFCWVIIPIVEFFNFKQIETSDFKDIFILLLIVWLFCIAVCVSSKVKENNTYNKIKSVIKKAVIIVVALALIILTVYYFYNLLFIYF